MNTSYQPGQGILWQDCMINSKTDLDAYAVKPLVTINGQAVLRQHETTYLTGKDTCRAHHFAKLLAASVLSGSGSGDTAAPVQAPTAGTVLWIDTVHGVHISTAVYRELAARSGGDERLHIFSLDTLGHDRYDFISLLRIIEAQINNLQPDLVIIDDIDHFMPYCGINAANGFCRLVHDFRLHTPVAFLFIGYNHLAKKASTTGNLGKCLFRDATNIFSLSTRHEVTTVRLVNSYDLSRNPDDTQYCFSVGPDNFPQESAAPLNDSPSGIDDDALRVILSDILVPGESISSDDLLSLVTARLNRFRRHRRSLSLINQALSLGILRPASEGDDSGKWILDGGADDEQGSAGTSLNSHSSSALDEAINNSLTLPPRLSLPSGPSDSADGSR